MGNHKIRTTPYRPSTNAVVERFHRTLNSMLAKVIAQNQRDWCEHLPGVMAAYRASLHETTQYSPNKLMFGRENRLPVDIVLGELTDRASVKRIDDFVEEMTNRQKEDFRLVRSHLGQAAMRRKQRYDDKVNEQTFQIGQLVWYFYPRKKQGLSPKWQSWYVGPYRVIRLIDSHNIVIQKSKKHKSIVVHRDKLKACITSPVATSATQPAASADDNHINTVPYNGVTSFHECSLQRPKRLTRMPKHMTDYVVSSVFRLQMASKMVHHARSMGLVCDVCSKAFAQRHGLKYHLESKIDDPHHAEYAKRELQCWRSRGQYRTADRRHIRPSSNSYSRESSMDRNSTFRRHASPGEKGSWNDRSRDCPAQREQGLETPLVRSVIRATTNSCASYDRPRLLHQRPSQRRSCSSSAAGRPTVSSVGSTYGPARTLYIGTTRLARHTLRDPSNIDPENAISLAQRVCPRMSTGQARVAAAAVFAGINTAMQAIFPLSGSPMSGEAVKRWQQAASVVCERMKIQITEDLVCDSEQATESQSKTSEEDLPDESVAVTVDFAEAESDIQPGTLQCYTEQRNETMMNIQEDVERNADRSDLLTVCPKEVIASHRAEIDVEPVDTVVGIQDQVNGDEVDPPSYVHTTELLTIPQNESVTGPPVEAGSVSVSTMSSDEVRADVQVQFLSETETSTSEHSTVETGEYLQSISAHSSPRKTRTLADPCSRSGTPPFRSAADGRTSNVTHVHGRCLHVEMPVPVARPVEEPELELEERISKVMTDPTSDVYWAVHTASPETRMSPKEQPCQQIEKPTTVAKTASKSDAISKGAIHSTQKRIAVPEVGEPPKKIKAVEKAKPSGSISSNTQKKQAEVPDRKTPKSSISALPGVSRKPKTVTPDNSSFALAIMANSIMPRKSANKISQTAFRKEEPEPKVVTEQGVFGSRATLQGTKETTNRSQTTDKENCSASAKKSHRSSGKVAHTSRKPLEPSRKSASSVNTKTTESANSTTASTDSVKEFLSNSGSTRLLDTQSTVTATTSTVAQQPGVMDPYAWACMFGAMAAGMSFFHGQPPRWPTGSGSETSTQSGDSGHINPVSSAVPPVWSTFPGFGFPFPRWSAP